MGAAGIWGELDGCFEKKDHAKAIQTLKNLRASTKDYEDIARSSMTMAELNLHNSKAEGQQKAVGYALVSGYCNLLCKRMAPAVAALEWLKKSTPEAETEISILEDGITDTFSKKGESKPKDLFSQISKREMAKLLSIVKVRECDDAELIFREGDPPEAFYVIADGEVHLESSKGLDKDLSEGDFFGELAVLGKDPRTASATAKGNCRLLEFQEDDLVKAFEALPTLEKRVIRYYEIRFFLSSIQQNIYFQDFSETDREEFFSYFKTGSSRKGATIISDDKTNEFLIFLLRGRVAIVRDGEEIYSLGAAQFFGETSFLAGEKPSAKVVAVEDVRYLFCPKEVYEKVIEKFPKLNLILTELAELRSASA